MKRGEEGVTLIELVLITGLLPIVLGALVAAFGVLMRSSNETTERLAESPQLQVAAAYFAADAASHDPAATPNGSCAPDADTIVTFAWVDPGGQWNNPGNADDTPVAARYSVTEAGGQKRLVRRLCDGNTVDDTTLVRHLDPNHAVPAATLPLPVTVTVDLRVCTADSAGACKYPALPFELTGSRRS